MNKLSAVIITFNEEANIGAALQSVAFADDVLVVDSGSTDATEAIVKKHGARFLSHRFEGYAAQKNWALDQCEHDWALILDADERITDPLQKEIQAVLQNPADFKAFSIGRNNYFMGRRVRYSGWQKDRVIRLIHREHARYAQTLVHEAMEVQGRIGDLRQKMDHFTYRDLDSYLEKSWKYATLSAQDRLQRGTRVTAYHLWFKPVWGFTERYILKRGFLDGKVGLIIAMQHASYLFNRALKLWRLQEGEKLKN